MVRSKPDTTHRPQSLPVHAQVSGGVLRAVEVSARTNLVDLRYDPIGFPWWLILSWGGLLMVGAWSAAAVVRDSLRAFGSV
jgi:hypothetical protein